MPKNARQLNLLSMMLLAMLVGILSGVGALIFRLLINSISLILFQSHATNLLHDTVEHTPLLAHPLGIIIIPVLGAGIVTYLVTHISKESKGHGVPEVMYAIHYNNGLISPIVAFVKALSSAITIGSGGSAGREGPIIQIGASLGSTIGQLISMPAAQRIVLIAAGAGSGISATFGAPITGLVFAIELMLITVNSINIMLISISIIFSSFVTYLFIGNAPEFTVIPHHFDVNSSAYLSALILLLPFSLFVGITSFFYVYLMNFCEIFFEKYFKNPYLRHMTGMALVGVILYLLGNTTGNYYVSGVGYATVNDIFQFHLTDPWLLILLCLCKIVATCLTLGSGGSGGLFSPALFIGAALGAAYAVLFNFFFPGQAYAVFFIIAGMAGVVSGATGLILTAIILAFEVTRDYSTIIPIMIVVTLSTAITAKFCGKNIFTLYASRKGFHIPYHLDRSTNLK